MLRLLKMALCAVVLTTSVWADSGSTDKVTLWLKLPNNFAPLIATQLERELQAVVEPSGLQLDWQRLPSRDGAVVDGRSIVVRFRGSCSPSLDHAGRRHTAAWAHVSGGNVLPFIEVDCDQVWSVIEPDLVNESGFQREFQFGRALARVLAHELHHVLSNTLDHGVSGLTKTRLESRDLISGKHTLLLADFTPRIRSHSPDAPEVTPVPVPSRSSGYSSSASSFAPSDSGR